LRPAKPPPNATLTAALPLWTTTILAQIEEGCKVISGIGFRPGLQPDDDDSSDGPEP
jgi:hypothetical protein